MTVVLERDGTIRKTTSNASGRYSIADVPVGTYLVEIYLGGFRPFTKTDVVVTAATTTSIDAKLRWNSGISALTPEGMDPADPVRARPVYEIVLSRIYRNVSDEILVVRTSLVPAVLQSEDWRKSFAPVADMRETLEGAADRAPVFLRPEAFPKGVKLIGSDEKVQRKTLLTPVFFSPDGRHAVVYYEHYCGNLCAEGVMVWLTRTTAGDWQISGSKLFWES